MTTTRRRPCRRLCCRGVETLERGQIITRCEHCHALLDREPAPPEMGGPAEREEDRAEVRAALLTCLGVVVAIALALFALRWAAVHWVVWETKW